MYIARGSIVAESALQIGHTRTSPGASHTAINVCGNPGITMMSPDYHIPGQATDCSSLARFEVAFLSCRQRRPPGNLVASLGITLNAASFTNLFQPSTPPTQPTSNFRSRRIPCDTQDNTPPCLFLESTWSKTKVENANKTADVQRSRRLFLLGFLPDGGLCCLEFCTVTFFLPSNAIIHFGVADVTNVAYQINQQDHYLSDRKHEIVFPFPHEAVELSRPGNIEVTTRSFLDHRCGHVSYLSFRTGKGDGARIKGGGKGERGA